MNYAPTINREEILEKMGGNEHETDIFIDQQYNASEREALAPLTSARNTQQAGGEDIEELGYTVKSIGGIGGYKRRIESRARMCGFYSGGERRMVDLGLKMGTGQRGAGNSRI